MKYVINSHEHAIGKVKDFFYRVEFRRAFNFDAMHQ